MTGIGSRGRQAVTPTDQQAAYTAWAGTAGDDPPATLASDTRVREEPERNERDGGNRMPLKLSWRAKLADSKDLPRVESIVGNRNTWPAHAAFQAGSRAEDC